MIVLLLLKMAFVRKYRTSQILKWQQMKVLYFPNNPYWSKDDNMSCVLTGEQKPFESNDELHANFTSTIRLVPSVIDIAKVKPTRIKHNWNIEGLVTQQVCLCDSACSLIQVSSSSSSDSILFPLSCAASVYPSTTSDSNSEFNSFAAVVVSMF